MAPLPVRVLARGSTFFSDIHGDLLSALRKLLTGTQCCSCSSARAEGESSGLQGPVLPAPASDPVQKETLFSGASLARAADAEQFTRALVGQRAALLFCPRRGQSLQKFLELCRSQGVSVVEAPLPYDTTLWERHCRLLSVQGQGHEPMTRAPTSAKGADPEVPMAPILSTSTWSPQAGQHPNVAPLRGAEFVSSGAVQGAGSLHQETQAWPGYSMDHDFPLLVQLSF